MPRFPELERNRLFPNFGRLYAKARGWRRLALRFFPLHAMSASARELKVARLAPLRARVRRKFRGRRGLLVNLGAGPQGKPGWINVDTERERGVNCLFDCRKELPFPDLSVRAIFCEHFLEHLDYTEEVPCFLSECRRVLEPGGVMRIIVPDAGRYLRAYCEEGWASMEAMRSLGPDRADTDLGGRYETKMELVNEVFRQGNDHKFAYDFETLALQLELSGFTRIARQAFGQSAMEGLALDQERRESESLYVEAIKA